MTAIDGPPGGGRASQARHRKLLRPARIRRSSGLSRPSRSNIPGGERDLVVLEDGAGGEASDGS